MTLQKLCAVTDFPTEGKKTFKVAGKNMVVFFVNDTYYAIDHKCSHMGGDLSKGALTGKTIKCPVHGAVFDLETGDVVQPVAGMAGKLKKAKKMATYKVKKQDDTLFVDL